MCPVTSSIKDMKLKKIALFIAAGIACLHSNSNAGSLSLAGVVTHSQPVVTSLSNTFTPQLGLGGGALYEFHLFWKVGLQFGALYKTRSYLNNLSGNSSLDGLQYLEFPVQFRIWPVKFFSIGFGGYYGMGIGNVHQSTDRVSVQSTFRGYGISGQDYGLLGSAEISIPVGASTDFFVQGQYLMSLNNLYTAGAATFKFTDIQGLAGVRFNFGTKR